MCGGGGGRGGVGGVGGGGGATTLFLMTIQMKPEGPICESQLQKDTEHALPSILNGHI